MSDLIKLLDSAQDDEKDAAYDHVSQQALEKVDINHQGFPAWYGWALRVAFFAGINWQKAKAPATDFKLNSDKSVAVSLDVYLNNDMSACPRGCKVQLLGRGGVLIYGNYSGNPFWCAWAPLPRRRA